MALHIYRFRQNHPFSDEDLERYAGAGVVNDDTSGGCVCDIEADDTNLADLTEYMLSGGYSLIATDPGSAPTTHIRITDGTFLSLDGLADGSLIRRNGLTLAGSSAGTGITIGASVAIDQSFSPTWTGIHRFNQRIEFVGGTAGAPGLIPVVGGTADTDTGIFSNSLNTLSASAAAIQAWQITNTVMNMMLGVRASGTSTPAALAGDQDNWNPTGFSTAFAIYADPNGANRNITGLTGGAGGRLVAIFNIGTGVLDTLTLTHEDGASTAANRFTLPGGASVVIGNRGAVLLQYDSATSRWRLLAQT